jgi:hypothetical protein
MQLGMIGLGRMGANMVRRLMRAGHTCVGLDHNADAVKELAGEGAVGAFTMEEFVAKLDAPRSVWMMVPAAVVDESIGQIAPLLSKGDALIDGGNSYYIDDIRRAASLLTSGIDYLDDRRPRRLGPALRSYLRGARPGARRYSAHAGSRKGRRHRRAGILALRPQRRRALREDGAQRHRVRSDGLLCRRLERSP